MVIVEDENGIVKLVPDKPTKIRVQRWSNLKQQKGKDLLEYIDSKSVSLFAHMVILLDGVPEAKLYVAPGSDTVESSSKGVSTELLHGWQLLLLLFFRLLQSPKQGL